MCVCVQVSECLSILKPGDGLVTCPVLPLALGQKGLAKGRSAYPRAHKLNQGERTRLGKKASMGHNCRQKGKNV